jgi:protein-tyrosine phosphatase
LQQTGQAPGAIRVDLRRVAMDRLLTLERGSNFRDLGGYPAADGRTVRWRRIFRSAALPVLTVEDFARLSELGVATVVDLRSSDERELSPVRWADGVRCIAMDYPASLLFNEASFHIDDPIGIQSHGLHEVFPTLLQPQFKQMFESLRAGAAPLVVYCMAGQDRTGIAIALILTALGVSRDVILEDYHLSTTHRRPENEIPPGAIDKYAGRNVVADFFVRALEKGGRRALAPRPLYNRHGETRLVDALRAIEAGWGGVPEYLAEALGVDAAATADLRRVYLEGDASPS